MRPADHRGRAGRGRRRLRLWAAVLAVNAFTLLVLHPGGRFAVQPAHFAERHSALLIIVFGESVADVGIGAGTAGSAVTVSLAVKAALGLALTAALWWAFLGVGDDERAVAEGRQAASGGLGGPSPRGSTSVEA